MNLALISDIHANLPALAPTHASQMYARNLHNFLVAQSEDGAFGPKDDDEIITELVGIQRAHVELYIRHLGDTGLMPSSVNTMMHGVRGFFRFAHIDGLIPADPAVYARLPRSTRTSPVRKAWTVSN